MGVDLALLPVDYEPTGPTDWSFAHSIIQVERRRELWDPIAEIEEREGKQVPPKFRTYLGRREDGESGYGNTQETPYGEPLRHVSAGALAALQYHEAVQDNPQNRAVWAYLASLPPNWRIALYWH